MQATLHPVVSQLQVISIQIAQVLRVRTAACTIPALLLPLASEVAAMLTPHTNLVQRASQRLTSGTRQTATRRAGATPGSRPLQRK